MKNENIHWRKAKLAALILERAKRGQLTARDRRLAALLAQDPGVSNGLIHQAVLSRAARACQTQTSAPNSGRACWLGVVFD